MKLLLTILLFVSFLTACKKDKDVVPERFCWQLIDFAGNEMSVICDKTEAELLECARNGSCALNINGGGELPPCNYYKVEGEKYCWMIGNSYFENTTEIAAKHISKCFFGNVTPTKVECGYCAFWYHRKKMTYKPANTFTYSSVRKERFCGDTTKTLFQGRQITIKDNADSVIVIQFSNNGRDW